MNQLVTYPCPKQAVILEDFVVRVRKAGDKEFIQIETYQVKVDLHDTSNASMVRFDFEGEVEMEISGPWYIYDVQISLVMAKK